MKNPSELVRNNDFNLKHQKFLNLLLENQYFPIPVNNLDEEIITILQSDPSTENKDFRSAAIFEMYEHFGGVATHSRTRYI